MKELILYNIIEKSNGCGISFLMPTFNDSLLSSTIFLIYENENYLSYTPFKMTYQPTGTIHRFGKPYSTIFLGVLDQLDHNIL